MQRPTRPFRSTPDLELEALVARTERALFAGTSGHRDLVTLIEAERELGYREAKRVRRTIVEERSARTRSASESGGWLAVPSGTGPGSAAPRTDAG